MTPKESFKYSYTKPCLDWYETVNIEIKDGEYRGFEIERRFGSTWYLHGFRDEKLKVISEINGYDLKLFIKWCETKNGSLITTIRSISTSINIIEDIKELLK